MTNRPTLRRRRFIAALGAGAFAGLGIGVARAQAAWPGKPVRIIVPFTPGTGMDILARTLAPHLQAAWGQGIVVDNRPGASGNLGASAVAKSAPDGLTLLMGVNTLIINPALYSNMTYDALKDLAPLGLCATGSFLLVAGAGAGINSVDELVKAARAKPGKLDYASPGIATCTGRNISGTSPDSTALTAPAVPENGMCVIDTLARSLKSSIAMWCGVAMPGDA